MYVRTFQSPLCGVPKKTAMLSAEGRIQFMARSRPVLPGHGKGECPMGEAEETKYPGLLVAGLPPDFRSMLSNFAPFETDNLLTLTVDDVRAMVPGADVGVGLTVPCRPLRFATVEHAFHCIKMLVAAKNPKVALYFEWDGGHPVGRCVDGVMVKKAGGKGGLLALTPEQRTVWDLHRHAVLQGLTSIKFSEAHPKFRDLLAATGSMRLVHAVRFVSEEWSWLYPIRAAAQGCPLVAMAE